MINSIKQERLSHKAKIKSLEEKKELAEMKRKELELKREILKLRFPFHIRFQFNKFIVIFCIVAIIFYTIIAISVQRYVGYELSPTLTTSIFAFFGTELLGLAGIKIFDTKFSNGSYSSSYSADSGISTMDEKTEVDLGSGDDSNSGGFGGVGGVHFDVGLGLGADITPDSTDGISTEMDPNAVG